MNKRLKGIKATTKQSLNTYIMVIAFFGILTLLINTGALANGNLLEGLLIPICYYIILAVSLNLIVGILGELSLGHAGFMCVGAYAGGLFSYLTLNIITSPLLRISLAFIVGGVAAGLFGLFIGFSVLRLKGDYLAIVTLAFGEITYKILQNCYLTKDINGFHFSFANPIDASKIDSASRVQILNGAMPVGKIPRNATVLIAVVLVLITLYVMYSIIDSRQGRAFKAIRDNRIAAESIGINVTKYKLLAFFVSSFFAGVAGTLFAHSKLLDASTFNYNTSILILVFVVLGGLGSIRGSVVAAIILYALPELLRDLQAYRMLMYAIILIVMMLLNNNDKFITFKDRLKMKLKFKKTEKEEI